MITPNQAHHGINMGLHICILFTFLTILFFMVISKAETKATGKELTKVVQKYIPKALNYIDKSDKKIFQPNGIIVWDEVDNLATKLDQKYNGSDPKIAQHNKQLLIKTIIIGGILWLVLIGLIVYFTVYKKYDIQLKSILIDNFFIFTFVGIIEVLFFTNIAIKYIPVTSADMTNSLIDRVNYHVKKQLKYS